jgi:3-hydroxyisobutyrate dehydrogenase
VQVYDVWAPSVEAAVAAGAKASPTPADAAQGAKILGLMVVNAVQVEDVLFGEGKVASGMSL